MSENTKTLHLHPHRKHWHYLYKRRKHYALGISASQMAWSQVLSLFGSVLAGVLLETNKSTLLLVAGAFVILPGVFDLDGSIGAVLSAKINHQLENTKQKAHVVFIHCVGFSILVATLAGVFVALTGAAIAAAFFDAYFWEVFWLAELAVILSGLIGFPLIGGLSILFRRFKINPDDVVGPIESSVFDILTIVTLAWVIGFLT